MIQPEFLYKLKQLPADTPITANHIVAILDTVASLIDKAAGIDFDSLPNSKLINEDMLADWLDESNSTLQKWRVKGGGPNYVRGPKSVRYSVGAVRDWIDSRTVKSTNESYSKGLSKLETLNNLNNTNSETINFPMMIVENKLVSFFNSFDDELDINGHTILCIKSNSPLRRPVLSDEIRDEAEKLLDALDEFNRTIVKNPKLAREIYGDWKSRVTENQRLGYFDTALAFDLDLAKEISLEFPNHFLTREFNPASWLLDTLTKHKSETLEELDLQWAFKYLVSIGININLDFELLDKSNQIIFSGTLAHLLANANHKFFAIAELTNDYQAMGSLVNELITLGLDVDLLNHEVKGLTAREMGKLVVEADGVDASIFISVLNKRELFEKLSQSIPKN